MVVAKIADTCGEVVMSCNANKLVYSNTTSWFKKKGFGRVTMTGAPCHKNNREKVNIFLCKSPFKIHEMAWRNFVLWVCLFRGVGAVINVARIAET